MSSGVIFNLVDTTLRSYLHHRSEAGEFILSSDTAIPTFSKESGMANIFAHIPAEDREAFTRVRYTIGGMMLFPGNCIGRNRTISQARGLHLRIKDRFDLTVECIRRHYRNERSPLSDVLALYTDFFALFGDFRGYVEYFLLQDLVTEDCSAVRFFMPFEDFTPWPLPGSIEVYRAYRQLAVGFIEARNQRIFNSSMALGATSKESA